jgi:glucosamine-6-phosphate deaminase
MDMSGIDPRKLRAWCSIPFDKLERHADLRVPFRLVKDSPAMGKLMAEELVETIEGANKQGEELRAIIPCGPSSWYDPFTSLVNERMVTLERLVVYHMDECLDWQGREIPRMHPYSFRGFMERQIGRAHV